MSGGTGADGRASCGAANLRLTASPASRPGSSVLQCSDGPSNDRVQPVAAQYFGTFRAHVPKIGFRNVTEDEALEVLTFVSFLHRRIDAAVSTDPTRVR